MNQSIKNTFIVTATVLITLLLGLVLATKLGLSIPLYVNQISTMKNDYFSVTAEGTAYAKPDVAVVNIGYTTEGSNVEQVQSKANEVINKITSDLKAIGIGEKDIQTTNYNINPDYDYSSELQKITGYSINLNMQVKSRDLEKGSQVIDIATKNGANQIRGVSFEIDDIEKYRVEARKQAIEKAKIKAEEIADETGITLGKIINVYESPIESPPPIYRAAETNPGGPKDLSTELQPGQTEVNVSVTLGYETR